MNRRSFMKRSLAAAAGMGMAPSLFSRTALAAGGNEKILIIFQLFGGNDAVNTLIPTGQYNDYARLRPDIAIPSNDIIDLAVSGMNLGMHPALRDVVDNFWSHGELALITQVGYPNHNRSHFFSTAVWNTADPDHPQKSGWLGRYVEDNDPFCATSLGRKFPRAIRGEHATGIHIGGIGAFNLNINRIDSGATAELERLLQQSRSGTAEGARLALKHMLDSVTEIQGARDSQYDPATSFPTHKNKYGQIFEDIARLIKYDITSRHNLPSQVYYASAAGYDTHASQGGKEGAQADLLERLAAALVSFRDEMIGQTRWDDVMIMIFSEFGRRVKQNASKGTDHGKGGLMLVAGGAVNGGIYGNEPNLDEDALDEGDLPVETDFRSVYAAGADFIGADYNDLVPGFSPLPGLF